jgi:hypothetical protein
MKLFSTAKPLRRLRPHGFPRRLEVFFETLLTGKLWLVTSFLFVAFGYYLNSLASLVPADIGEVEQRQRDYDNTLNDFRLITDHTTTLITAAQDSGDAFRECLKFRQNNLRAKLATAHLSLPADVVFVNDEDTQGALAVTVKARTSLSSAFVVVKGPALQTPQCFDYYSGYSDTLGQLDTYLLTYQRFYNTTLDKQQASKVPALLAELEELDPRVTAALNTLNQQIHNTQTHVKNNLDQFQIQLKRREQLMLILVFKFFLVVSLFILFVLFAILTYRAHRTPKYKNISDGPNLTILKAQRKKYQEMRNNRHHSHT